MAKQYVNNSNAISFVHKYEESDGAGLETKTPHENLRNPLSSSSEKEFTSFSCSDAVDGVYAYKEITTSYSAVSSRGDLSTNDFIVIKNMAAVYSSSSELGIASTANLFVRIGTGSVIAKLKAGEMLMLPCSKEGNQTLQFKHDGSGSIAALVMDIAS